jgi:ribosomal protein L40E
MTCSACDAPLNDDARFCAKCGTPVDTTNDLPTTCTGCNAELLPNATFCSACGMKVGPSSKGKIRWGVAKGNGTWRGTLKGREVLEVPDAVVAGGAKAVAIAAPIAATFIGEKLASKRPTKGSHGKT